MLADPARLGARARAAILDTGNELLLSAASSWEIAIKYGLGKLSLPQPPQAYVPDRVAATGVIPLAIEHSHALAVAALPRHHRDPFDRLLIAQAQLEKVPIMTSDSAFRPYGVRVIPANR